MQGMAWFFDIARPMHSVEQIIRKLQTAVQLIIQGKPSPISTACLMGFPRFQGQVNRGHAIPTRLSTHDEPHQNSAAFHGTAEGGGHGALLQVELSCNAFAERLGLPTSSLARWVRQAGPVPKVCSPATSAPSSTGPARRTVSSGV